MAALVRLTGAPPTGVKVRLPRAGTPCTASEQAMKLSTCASTLAASAVSGLSPAMTKVISIVVALKGSMLALGVAAGERLSPSGSVRVTLAVRLPLAVPLEERVAVDVTLALT